MRRTLNLTSKPTYHHRRRVTSLKALSFAELAAQSIGIGALAGIYDRAASLWPDKPIVFDLTYDEPDSNGGMRETRTHVKIWLKTGIENVTHTLAHELAHVINQRETSPPRLYPGKPGQPERQLLSDLINIPGHQRVHRIMADFGFDTKGEVREKSARFLEGIAGAPLDRDGASIGLSTGYALVLAVYGDDELVDRIRSAMRAKSPHAADLGERLAAYVLSKKSTSLYEDAVALMRIAAIGPEYQAYVMTAESFRERFGR